ncbi:MAG: carboxymuconolactone decarboxylase family protein [Rhodospirillaceae bacterium]
MGEISRRSALTTGSLALVAAVAGADKAAAQQSPPAPSDLQQVYKAIPQMGRLREEVLFGDVWKQPELNTRDRSLVTCAVLAALGRDDELALNLTRAAANGVTADEIRGLAVQVAFYAGWPAGLAVGKAALPILQKDSKAVK